MNVKNTVSVVLVEDSSLANARLIFHFVMPSEEVADFSADSNGLDDFKFEIFSVIEVSEDVIKLSSSQGSFFLRAAYLQNLEEFDISPNAVFNREQAEDCLQAAFTYSAENVAVTYLARSEQSAFLLKRKLLAKGHQAEYIDKALEYLKGRGWLSDERYAGAFLRSRSINRSEGRARLMGELATRGIDKETANVALDDFFERVDENEILQRAFEKCQRQGKNEEQTRNSLMRLGFGWKDIKKVMSEQLEN